MVRIFKYTIEYYEKYCNTIYNTNVNEIIEDISGHLQMDPNLINFDDIYSIMKKGNIELFYVKWFPLKKKKKKYIFKLVNSKKDADFSLKKIR